MGKNFLDLKRKIFCIMVAKTIIFGLSVGAIIGLTVALVQRLTLGKADLLLCVLIGLGAMVISGGALLLLDFPSEKKIAKKIDEGLSLNEKVQTLVAFKAEDGTIVKMQRESTNELLNGVGLKQLFKKRMLLNLVAPLLAIAMMVLVIIVPPKEITSTDVPPPITDPDFDITKIQIQELEELIEYVKESGMDESARALTVTQLEGLLAALKSEEKITVGQMKEKVYGVILEVRKILDNVNSSDDISFEINKSKDKKLLRLALAIQGLNGISAELALDEMRLTLPDTISKSEISNLSSAYSKAIKDALAASGTKDSDILYLSLLQLANKLEDIGAKATETAMIDLQSDLRIIFEDARINVGTALNIQLNNSEIAETVVDTLIDIFGLSLGEIPEYEDEDFFVSVELPGENPDDKPTQGGGAGDGEMLYGSKDKIYDPVTGEFVEYGTLIDAYLAALTEQVQDGRVPMELEEFISDYFATLYGGSK